MKLTNLPTPLEIVLDPISLIIIAMFVGLMIWESVFPAKAMPEIKGWKLRGLSSFFIFFFLSSYLPMFTDSYLAKYQLFDISEYGTLVGVVVGVLIFQLGTWIWHRLLHASDTLWHGFHQMHHSAERLDMYGAFYFSLFDMIGWTLLGSITLVLGVGINADAAVIVLLLVTFMAMFTHANIKTPVWLGYIIARPESHSIHHKKGHHNQNYCELPLFDMLFGTFRNPKNHSEEIGFYDGASQRVLDMHLFRNVSTDNS